MLWNDGGEAALKHYGKVLSILEQNQLQHALNGNIKDEDDQPGYCYLRLFKKELRDLIDWPAYLTLLEICQWEVELHDDRVMVGLVKAKGRTVWHVEGRGDLSWVHLTKMKEDLGHILLGADQ